MARARNIKPSFFDNDTLALENDPLGRLLFIGLWTLADCNGNLEWRSARIKARLLPYDECDIEVLAKNLERSGFIRFYSDGEKLYTNIPKFVEHQNPHKNERDKGGEVPEYNEDRRQLVDLQELTINPDFSGAEPSNDGSNRADSPSLNDESPILNPESETPDAGASDGGEAPPDSPPGEPPDSNTSTDQPDPVHTVFEHWVYVMGKDPGRTKLTAERRKKIRARLEDYSVEDCCRAIDGCAGSPYHMARSPDNTTQMYNTIELIFRNGEKLERFRDMAEEMSHGASREPGDGGDPVTNAIRDTEDRSWADGL